MFEKKKFAVVGGGCMGEALIRGLLSGGLVHPEQIIASTRSEDRSAYLVTSFGVTATQDNCSCVEQADVVMVCLKPAQFPAVTNQIKGSINPSAVVISIMAGVTTATIAAALENKNVIRAMPNLPGMVHAGVTGWTAHAGISTDHLKMGKEILSVLGTSIYFSEEKYMDMVTAISGSGPGFAALVMEGFEDAAVHIGFSRADARSLVLATVLGTAIYAKQSGKSFTEIRHQVCSPGGTTCEGIYQLERLGLRSCLGEAVLAAYQKAQKLGAR